MMRAVRVLAVSDNEATSSQVQECRGDRITLDKDKKDKKAPKLACRHRSAMAIAHVNGKRSLVHSIN